MIPVEQIGKYVIGIGLILVITGIIIILAPKLPFLKKFGQLPGDIRLQSKDGKFVLFAPIVSSILLSLFLTIVINVLVKILRK